MSVSCPQSAAGQSPSFFRFTITVADVTGKGEAFYTDSLEAAIIIFGMLRPYSIDRSGSIIANRGLCVGGLEAHQSHYRQSYSASNRALLMNQKADRHASLAMTESVGRSPYPATQAKYLVGRD